MWNHLSNSETNAIIDLHLSAVGTNSTVRRQPNEI